MTLKETKLYGLVLAGGKSSRMGHDKSIIKWHGKEQRYYIADLLAKLCDEVYISCREEQQGEIDIKYKTITDKAEGKGPVVGIQSAFATHDNVAWLVVACDLPLIDEKILGHLIANREVEKIATTYKSPHDVLPEPLITIWEPKSIEALEAFRAKGYNCPRKVLINSDTKIIEPPDEEALINANTPDDAARVTGIIEKRTAAIS